MQEEDQDLTQTGAEEVLVERTEEEDIRFKQAASRILEKKGESTLYIKLPGGTTLKVPPYEKLFLERLWSLEYGDRIELMQLNEVHLELYLNAKRKAAAELLKVAFGITVLSGTALKAIWEDSFDGIRLNFNEACLNAYRFDSLEQRTGMFDKKPASLVRDVETGKMTLSNARSILTFFIDTDQCRPVTTSAERVVELITAYLGYQ